MYVCVPLTYIINQTKIISKVLHIPLFVNQIALDLNFKNVKVLYLLKFLIYKEQVDLKLM